MKYQLIIIGGGASGLAAAVTAASYGVGSIAIIERSARVGKKILATGNGRCNLSHTPVSASDYDGSVQVGEILAAFGSAEVFFENLGLCCRTDSAGRIYPYSMHAASVLDALRLACRRYGVTEICEETVSTLLSQKGVWRICTEKHEYIAENVIFAAGGFAAPQHGTDGSAWELLRKLQIPLAAPSPVLCPLLSDARMLRPLKGLRVRADARLMLGERCLYQESGEVQFTDRTVSGICIFNMVSHIRQDRLHDYRIVLDLIPEQNPEKTLSMLYGFQAVRSDGDSEALLSGLFQKSLSRLILRECGVMADMSCMRLDSRKLRNIAETIHRLSFPVTGISDWKQAQATAGGVTGAALDAHLQVKRYPHLYVVGEAADVHSLCGGYHLHWAWASGAWAAKHIAERSCER